MINKFFKALQKTRDKFKEKLSGILKGKTAINDEILEELERILIEGDVGMKTSSLILEKVQEKAARLSSRADNPIMALLKEEISALLGEEQGALCKAHSGPNVILFVGINGTGKTTTIAKIAHRLLKDNNKVLLAACDTFRAAAVEQLAIWSKRLDIALIHHGGGSDPAAVAFDAADAALSRNMDYLLIDTAGRMHTKVNLMEELKKIKRTIQKKIPGAPQEILLVLDATVGQNGLIQAKEFKKEIGVTGIIITKLDGTAKGGIVLSIKQELNIPVYFIGVGEQLDALEAFSAKEYAEALLGEDLAGTKKAELKRKQDSENK